MGTSVGTLVFLPVQHGERQGALPSLFFHLLLAGLLSQVKSTPRRRGMSDALWVPRKSRPVI